VSIVVIGAAGDLGGRVVAGLRARNADVRGLARRPVPGCVVGDLADPASLDAAFAGATRVFLQSSPVREQVALETNAIDAAERNSVQQIVKISNIPIPGLETGLHGNHRAIEARLAASAIASTVLQPSFFANVIEKQRDQIDAGKFIMPTGDGKIAWIDPDDIAACAVDVLMRDDVLGAHVITGPEALRAGDVADRLGVKLLQPPITQWRDAVVAGGLDPWLADSTVHLYEAVSRGALEAVTGEVPELLGRPARPVFGVSGRGDGR
jgi:uncharacterized protein YbjT (DUF2867 family)